MTVPHAIEMAPGVDALLVRARGELTAVVVHRIEVSQEDPSYGDAPAEVARFFREHPVGQRATGGAMPYPILIDATGRVTQSAPLLRQTPHAVSHNPTSIGVACVGDFRSTPPTAEQGSALVAVCSALLSELGAGADALLGHDELTGGSHDPDKECPGRLLSMAALRREVAEQLARGPSPSHFEW